MTRRVMVVEADALVATGLRVALADRGWEVLAAAGAMDGDLVERARGFRPECMLVDIDDGPRVAARIDLIHPLASIGAKVVLLTAERRRTVLAACLEAGAEGWIGKSAALDEVDSALARVAAGNAIIGRTERVELLERLRDERTSTLRTKAHFDQLTPREARVLGALADGLSAEEIAQQHFVALTTVRSQIRAVLQKLGVRSQLAAVAIADAHRWALPSEAQPERDRRRQRQHSRAGDRAPLVQSA